MEEEIPRFKIVMFPWLAHGHIFPYLELAKRILIRKNFYIYFCSTAINFSSINDFLEKNLLNDSVELVEIHLQPSPDLPPHYHTTKNLPSNLVFTLIKAFQTSKTSFFNIAGVLKPDLIIYDVFQPWAAKYALSKGIPSVHFSVLGAAKFSVTHHQYLAWDANFPFPGLCLKDHEKKSFETFFKFMHSEVFDEDKDNYFVNFKLSSEIVLLKSSRALEGKYLDYISDARQKKFVPVGPLATNVDNLNEENSDVMQWLSKKRPHSTVYISFGSEYFLSKEEIAEIAKGLELCDVNFIWVIRSPIEATISTQEALPDGFLEKVSGRGLVVSGWAPQGNILAHSSTGGFVSHCGWSSLNESIYYGVPVIGMPMILSMIVDARMLAEAGVCVVVPRNEAYIYEGEEIAKVIIKVVVEKSGERLRLNAQELSDKLKMGEGQEMDEAAEQLWQICMKNKQQEV